jgi:predicted lipoprotein with Yx(FWY)xxD motif
MTRNRHAAPSPRRTRAARPRRASLTGIVGGIVGFAAAAIALLLVTAACGSTVQTVPAREAAPVGIPSEVEATPGLATSTTSLGTVVTMDGYTLYRFSKDTTAPSKSTCNAECAKTWPPVLGDGQPKLTGVPADKVGTIGRADGSQQLTLNGWPLYRYAKDTKPGETAGEGVGGTWRAIGVNGKPAADSAPAAPAPAPKQAPKQVPTPAAPPAAPAADTSSDYSSSGY